MKRLFTLAIVAMIASLTFAQAPAHKAKASDRQIEKVIPHAQIQKAMEAKKVAEAKAMTAQETSGSVLRKAAKPQTDWTLIPNANVRQVYFNSNLKDRNPMTAMLKKSTRANHSFAKMGAKYADDYTEMEATSYSAQYYTSDGDWFCVLSNSSTAFRFDIPTFDPTPFNGTYTIDQMDLDYSWAGANVYVAKSYTEATFTVNADGTEAEAYVTLEDGAKYHVTYVKPEDPEVTDQVTYEFSADECELDDYIASDGVFQIVGWNDEGIEAYLAFFADQLYGTFTIDDIYPEYTNLYLGYDDYDGVAPFALNATVTAESATVIYSGYNGVEYTLIFHFAEGGNQGEEPAGDVTITKDNNGIITSVAGGQVKTYTRSADGSAYYLLDGSMYSAKQSGSVQVVENGDKVYIKDIISRYTKDSWVEGTKEGNTITVPAKQPLVYNASYDATISLRWGVIDAEGYINVVDDHADSFVFTVDGDVWTLQGTSGWDGTADAYYMGAFWDDDDSATGYGDAETVLTLKEESGDDDDDDDEIITDLTATLPYVNGFETNAEKNEAAIYDANNDGKTWVFASDTDNSTNAVRYAWNSSKDADDYVVFPGLTLKAGVGYKVAVDARANGTLYAERIEVVAGQVAKASELNIEVIPATDLATRDYQTLNAVFTPEADGVYYFALHAISDADMYYLYADNFSVKEDNPNTPMPATDFSAVAGENGALSAKLTFTLPTTTTGGAALDMVEYVISRDGEEIIQGAAAAGSTKTKTDSEAKNGTNNYTLVVKSNGLISDPVSTSVYVGEDLPVDVENLTATDKNNIVGLTWDPVTEGAQGGYVNPENLTYNVYPVEMFEFLGMQFPSIDFDNPYATGVKETSYDVEYNTNEGAQGYTYFGVTAENPAGETNGMMAAVLTGAAYELPMHEGLTGQALHYWWGTDCDDDNYYVDGGLYIGTEASDEDGVSFLFDAETAGWIDLYSGKIALDGADNAGLSFDYMADAPAVLHVLAVTPEGETEIETINVAASNEFASVKVSLADYAAEPWVRFTLHAEFEDAALLYVDNVNVMDFIADNLSISVSAPKSVVAGQAVTVKATVKNEGENAAEGYDVKFYINDNEAAAPLFEAPALGFLQTAEFEFELETSIFDEAGDVVVKAEVVYAADLKDDDNADEVVVEVVAPSATPVESLEAEVTEEGVLLTWTVSDTSASEITESFEDYAGNTIYADGEACGPWSAVDLSQGSAYGWNTDAIQFWGNSQPSYMGSTYAFGIINFAEANMNEYSALSGEQVAVFMSEVDPLTNEGQEANKYMISSELPGVAQTVSFSAYMGIDEYGPELFEVLASSTDNKVESFTVVESFALEVAREWKEFSAQLPEGTKYFAIHYISNDVFYIFVDDLKYTSSVAAPTGFNIYVDEALVATADAEATSYLYSEANGANVRKLVSAAGHTFSVTAVYGNQESAPVSVVIDDPVGIQNIIANSAAEVYTVDGIRVNNANELKAGVYVVNGMKQVVK